MSLDNESDSPLDTSSNIIELSLSGKNVHVSTSPDQVLQIQDQSGSVLGSIPDWAAEENPEKIAQQIGVIISDAKTELGIILPNDPTSFPMSVKITCTDGYVYTGDDRIDTFDSPYTIEI